MFVFRQQFQKLSDGLPSSGESRFFFQKFRHHLQKLCYLFQEFFPEDSPADRIFFQEQLRPQHC